MNDTIWADGVWAAGVFAVGFWAARYEGGNIGGLTDQLRTLRNITNI